MERIVRAIRARVGRTGGVERFVRLIVGGGIAVVSGTWTVALAPAWSPVWMVGAALTLFGTAGLLAGIRSGIDS